MFARHMATHTRDWLRIAHDTFLWRHLPAWNRSLAKQVVKHPKGLLQDSGLLHRLLRIATPCWEGMVIELRCAGLRTTVSKSLKTADYKRFHRCWTCSTPKYESGRMGFRVVNHCTPLHPGVNLPLNESELEDLGR